MQLKRSSSSYSLTQIYSKKRVLVTGGAGFIGSNLVNALVAMDADVTVLDCILTDSGANRFNLSPSEGKYRWIQGDLGDPKLIESALENKDYVFNLGGTLSHTDSMKYPLQDLYANCTSHIVLLEAARKINPTTRILYAGTRGQYGKPQSLPVNEKHPLESVDANGINKTAGESYHLLYARHYDLFACSLRLSNTYGPRHQMRHHRQGVLNWFVRQVLDSKPIVVYGIGEQVRDANYVDDVVDAMLFTLSSERSRGQTFNLGGFPISLDQLGNLLVKLNSSGQVEKRVYPADAKNVEVGDYIADCTKIRSEIGWIPQVTNEEGFRRTLEFYREHRNQYW